MGTQALEVIALHPDLLQLEVIAARKREAKPARKARTALTPELKQLETNLRERIGVRATITGNTVRGLTLQK